MIEGLFDLGFMENVGMMNEDIDLMEEDVDVSSNKKPYDSTSIREFNSSAKPEDECGIT